MNLGEYLSKNHGDFNYKSHDCSKWMGGWISLNYGSCPLRDVGISYNNERQAKLLIGRSGSLLNLWSDGLKFLGFKTVTKPESGDIAILEIPTEDSSNQTCGIWTGSKWASVHYSGTLFGEGDPLVIWRL